jgi:hypothetical protein
VSVDRQSGGADLRTGECMLIRRTHAGKTMRLQKKPITAQQQRQRQNMTENRNPQSAGRRNAARCALLRRRRAAEAHPVGLGDGRHSGTNHLGAHEDPRGGDNRHGSLWPPRHSRDLWLPAPGRFSTHAPHPCSCITDPSTTGGLLAEGVEGVTARIPIQNARLPLLATAKDLEKPAEEENRGRRPLLWSSACRFRE